MVQGQGRRIKTRRLDKRALHTDQTEAFLSCKRTGEDNELTIRLRTGRNNVDSCRLLAGGQRIRMRRFRTEGCFDYYSATLKAAEYTIRYLFELVIGERHVFYTAGGVRANFKEEDTWIFRPGVQTPQWAQGAVMYQIFTDRFCNGDPENDVLTGEYFYSGDRTERVENWEELPRPMDLCRHYGGDLRGIINKLDYLQKLGIEVIYLNPIFVSPSNHKYDTQDYEHVDPHFGEIVRKSFPTSSVLPPGEKDNRKSPVYLERVLSRENLEASDAVLAELIAGAHKRGMRVILDGVFNHCGSFHRWMDRERIYENQGDYAPGAYWRENSPFHNYFRFGEGRFVPGRTDYEVWWDVETLPKLSYETSEKLQEEILRAARKWLLPPYNADGWRLDVAADLGHSEAFNHSFWKRFRTAVKEARPDAVIIAEHYGDASAWLEGDEWDTVMNYDYFMDPVTWFLTGMDKHSDVRDETLRNNPDAFWKVMGEVGSKVPAAPFLCSMNQLSNHDHSRFLTRTSGKVGRLGSGEGKWDSAAASEGISKSVMKEAVLLQMTWPGAPCVYYGDEAGVCGFTDPDCRRPYPWGREDQELLSFTRMAIALRRNHSALRKGSLVRLTDRGGLLSFGRFDRKESLVVILNNEEHSVECSVPARYAGVPEEAKMEVLLRTGTPDEPAASAGHRVYSVHKGTILMKLPPQSGIVLGWHRDSRPDQPGKKGSTMAKEKKRAAEFERRLAVHLDELKWLYCELYHGDMQAFNYFCDMLYRCYESRPTWLRAVDRKREKAPNWYKGSDLLGMILYVDAYAGTLEGVRNHLDYLEECGANYLHLMPLLESPEGRSDGGYAVSNFHKVQPELGTMEELADLSKDCHDRGMCVCLDFVMNHTSEDHEWAKRAKAGEKEYQDRYFFYDDWTIPNEFEKTVPQVFPQTAPGSFSWCEEAGKVVMTSFYPYQWDLNYANPVVFNDMTEEMLNLCNHGVDVVRLDATPYIWKELGTNCRNLPQVHTLVRLMHMAADVVCPGTLLLGEIVMEPSKVVPYFGTVEKPECQMLYNVTTMASTWHTVATRDVRLLRHQMGTVFALPKEYTFLNYLRCHDDIGWGLDYPFLNLFGQEEIPHKKYLNDYFTGKYYGSDARGELYNDAPELGDARLCGTTASLCGVEAAEYEQNSFKLDRAIRLTIMLHAFLLTQSGIPILYAGDEIGQLNDYTYHENPLKCEDSRYLHRGAMDWESAERRNVPGTRENRIFTALRTLETLRRTYPVFDNNADMWIVEPYNDHILGIGRYFDGQKLIALFNFSEFDQTAWIDEEGEFTDLVTGEEKTAKAVKVPAYDFAWLFTSFGKPVKKNRLKGKASGGAKKKD